VQDMSETAFPVSRVIAIEEHIWTPELRAALLKHGGDETVTTWERRRYLERA